MELPDLCARCGRAGSFRSDNFWLWDVRGEVQVCPECLHAEEAPGATPNGIGGWAESVGADG